MEILLALLMLAFFFYTLNRVLPFLMDLDGRLRCWLLNREIERERRRDERPPQI